MEQQNKADVIQAFYDERYAEEWGRLERHPVEFELTKRFITRYIKPGDKVLDLGGGPGRYAMYLAEYGCDVTLADLSPGNIAFAKEKAAELGLSVRCLVADARTPEALQGEVFDHILLLGPLYHLAEEADRVQTINACLDLLKLGGTLACAFISSYAGLVYYMRERPEMILLEESQKDFQQFREDRDFSGMAFTYAYFIRHEDALPFMSQFPLEKLHFLSAEGMLGPNELTLLEQPPEVLAAWIDLAEEVCEREDLLSFAEHYLYIGRKI